MALRKGMWVVDGDGSVGIVAAFNGDGTVEVHNVDGDGTTTLIRPAISAAGLRQAFCSEIPEARRPAEDVAASLGYV